MAISGSRFTNLASDQLAVLGVLSENTGMKYTEVLRAVNALRGTDSYLVASRVISVLQTLQHRRLAFRRGAGLWLRTEAGTRVLEKQ